MLFCFSLSFFLCKFIKYKKSVKLFVFYISVLSVLINFIKLFVLELIIFYLGFIIILLYLREIYRMCKGKLILVIKI